MAPSVSGPGLASRDLGERTNLPLQLTSFVGRGAEIDEVKRFVSESRLVTLTGAAASVRRDSLWRWPRSCWESLRKASGWWNSPV
jgi:hypothetical protein